MDSQLSVPRDFRRYPNSLFQFFDQTNEYLHIDKQAI